MEVHLDKITGLLKTHGELHGETMDSSGLPTLHHQPLIQVFAELTCHHLTQLLDLRAKFEKILLLFIA